MFQDISTHLTSTRSKIKDRPYPSYLLKAYRKPLTTSQCHRTILRLFKNGGLFRPVTEQVMILERAERQKVNRPNFGPRLVFQFEKKRTEAEEKRAFPLLQIPNFYLLSNTRSRRSVWNLLVAHIDIYKHIQECNILYGAIACQCFDSIYNFSSQVGIARKIFLRPLVSCSHSISAWSPPNASCIARERPQWFATTVKHCKKFERKCKPLPRQSSFAFT